MGNTGHGGDQSSLPEQQDCYNEMLEHVGLEWNEIISIEDVGWVVGGERLEFREEQVQCVGRKGAASCFNVTGPF